MGSQSILDIVFKTSKQGQGGKEAAAELKELKGTVGELSSGFLGINLASITAAGAVTAVGGAVMAVGQSVAQAVKDYQAYGEEVRKISAVTGTGAEQTSRLMKTFDDLGVSQETFASVAMTAARKGFVMTIDNVANLADQYNALGTQEEKNALLNKELGKGGEELAAAFERGGQAIKDMAAAQEAGNVITEKQAYELELLRRQQNDLSDRQTAASNQLAQVIVPAQLDFTNAILKTLDGQYSLMNFINGTGIAGLANHEKQVRQSTEALDAYGESMQPLPDMVAQVYAQQELAVKPTDDLKTATSNLTTEMTAYNRQLMFKIASQNLDVNGQMALAASMGLIDEKSRYAIVKTQEWAKELQDHAIDVATYNRLVAGLANSLERITSKDATITIDTVYTTNGASRKNGGFVDANSANGGTFTVPPGYPNDTFIHGLSSGETVTVQNDRTRATGSSSGASGGSGVTINFGDVNISGEMSYQTFKNRLLQDMKAARS